MARTMSTWLLQGALVVLPLLSIALGASMLGVGGHVLAFTHEHRNDKVPVRTCSCLPSELCDPADD